MRLAFLIYVAAHALACSAEQKPLEIATTTSVVNSGLLGFVLPHFDQKVRVHAAGSGRALAMLSDQTVDLVISHAPESEARSLVEHSDWRYRKIAYNHFVIVGPSKDPAGVRTAVNAVDAFRRIAAHNAVFVSRGDQSGTHERELALWREAEIDPAKEQILTSGGSMAIALRQADERFAYTLSDEATWWQLQQSLHLQPLFANDPALLNSYAVIHPAGSAGAAALATWLAEGAGREHIGSFRASGRQPFTLWPRNCPGNKPSDLPCN